MKSKFKSFVMFLPVILIGGVAHGLSVGPTLFISDGTDPIIIVNDNGTGDLNPATGELTLSTNVGVWSLSISTGISKPSLGSTTNPVMDIVIQASSTGAGSLTYTFSDNNFESAPGLLNAAVSGQVISGATTTVAYSVYGDPDDTEGALTTFLATTGTNSLPIATSSPGTLALPDQFSLSQVVQLTASGASAVSVDASLSVIPEPSSAALAFVGLPFLVAGLARRRGPLNRVRPRAW